jgi:hypothetical protein
LLNQPRNYPAGFPNTLPDLDKVNVAARAQTVANLGGVRVFQVAYDLFRPARTTSDKSRPFPKVGVAPIEKRQLIATSQLPPVLSRYQ